MDSRLMSIIGIILFLIGAVGIILNLVGLKLSVISFLNQIGNGFAFLMQIVIMIVGILLLYFSRVDFSKENEYE